MRLILILTAMAATPALAQAPADPAPAPMQATAPDAALPPTLSITAHIEAKSIRIQQKGDGQVSVWADPGGKGEWKFDRHGVPDPIPVGKTFNNVSFDLNAHPTIDDKGVSLGASAAPADVAQQAPSTPAPQ